MKPATRPGSDTIDRSPRAAGRRRRLRGLAASAVLAAATATAGSAHALTIVPTNDAAALVQALAGQGVNVVSFSLAPAADFNDDLGTSPPTGVYDDGPLGLPDGIVLTSGTARNAEPPNDNSGTTGYSSFGGTALCQSIAGVNTNDANTLVIQFTLAPGSDGIAFEWMFGSEEYPEYVGSFNDSVGVFIRSDDGSGWGPMTNIALDSGGNPVTINGPFFSGPTVIVPDAQNPITEYDGSTPHITTSHQLASGPTVVHELTIVVCDALDTSLDSGVLIGGLRACNGVCDAVQYCGDGLVNGNEDCDDGNNDNGDGCSNTCKGPDTDGDGLSDFREGVLGTDPANPDTDGDTVPDGLEVGGDVQQPLDWNSDGVLDALDPCYPDENNTACDQDGDGLTDNEEILVGTNPSDNDTDGDGVPDGIEVGSPNFPKDSDFDGTIDGLESSTEDSDGDGSPDQFDATNGDPCAPSTQAGPCDQDQDGLTNAEETGLGTDPTDADSDDDGVLDGQEPMPGADSDNDGIIDALDPDSDNDGSFDGTEMGLGCGHPDTDAGAGHCAPDADNGETTTDPTSPDTDGDGILDGSEDWNGNGTVDPGETDPTNGEGPDGVVVDSDGDGLSDGFEQVQGSNPTDADSDDDGVLDGYELNASLDTDGDGLINMLDPDSDDDGLFDGTEQGQGCLLPDTILAAGHCIADADGGLTTTNPLDADTDGGGAKDGAEDWNHDGKLDPGELDPTAGHGADDVNLIDSDADGLSDAEEMAFGSDPFDSDSDDDGVVDGAEINPTADFDGDGLVNAADADSDNDGIFDGTEQGQGCVLQGAINCIPDSDGGATQTGALNPDSDGGGVKDGVEDKNHNGVVDPGEGDPNDPTDDVCTQSSECAIDTQVCDPTNGQCVDPLCDAMTECPPPDACHFVGICEPASGTCLYNDKPEGTPCNDDNVCTFDSCQAGVCESVSFLDGTACELDGVPGLCIAGNCLVDSDIGQGGSGNTGGSSAGGGGAGGNGNTGGDGNGGGDGGSVAAGGDGSGANAAEDAKYALQGGGCSTGGSSSSDGAVFGLLIALGATLARRRRSA